MINFFLPSDEEINKKQQIKLFKKYLKIVHESYEKYKEQLTPKLILQDLLSEYGKFRENSDFCNDLLLLLENQNETLWISRLEDYLNTSKSINKNGDFCALLTVFFHYCADAYDLNFETFQKINLILGFSKELFEDIITEFLLEKAKDEIVSSDAFRAIGNLQLLSNANQDKVIEFLIDATKYTKSAGKACGALGTIKVAEKYQTSIFEALTQLDLDDGYIYSSVCTALSNLDFAEKYIEKILVILLKATNHKISDVRHSAISGLGNLKVTEQNQETIINELILIINNDTMQPFDRFSASQALSRFTFADKFYPRVIALITATENEYPAIISALYHALSKLHVSNQQPEEIFNIFLMGIENSNLGIRISAYSSIPNLQNLNKEQQDITIEVLFKGIDDKECKIRGKICEDIGNLYFANEYQEKISNFLIEKTEDESSNVRANACIALSKLKFSEDDQVIIIEILLKKTKDDSSEVRKSAIDALGNIQVSAKNEETIIVALEELKNDIKDCGKEINLALGKRKNDINLNIPKIIELEKMLFDENLLENFNVNINFRNELKNANERIKSQNNLEKYDPNASHVIIDTAENKNDGENPSSNYDLHNSL